MFHLYFFAVLKHNFCTNRVQKDIRVANHEKKNLKKNWTFGQLSRFAEALVLLSFAKNTNKKGHKYFVKTFSKELQI